eukprot:scaffold101445_cov35-Tisochrysis_lutea.AAC.1
MALGMIPTAACRSRMYSTSSAVIGRSVPAMSERRAGSSAWTASAAICAQTPVGMKRAASLPSAAATSASNPCSHSPEPYTSASASSSLANIARSARTTCAGRGAKATERYLTGGAGALQAASDAMPSRHALPMWLFPLYSIGFPRARALGRGRRAEEGWVGVGGLGTTLCTRLLAYPRRSLCQRQVSGVKDACLPLF